MDNRLEQGFADKSLTRWLYHQYGYSHIVWTTVDYPRVFDDVAEADFALPDLADLGLIDSRALPLRGSHAKIVRLYRDPFYPSAKVWHRNDTEAWASLVKITPLPPDHPLLQAEQPLRAIVMN